MVMNVVLNNRIYTYHKLNNSDLPSGIWLMCSIALMMLILSMLKTKEVKKIALSEKQFYGWIIFSLFCSVIYIKKYLF